jgi:hypothetical protein
MLGYWRAVAGARLCALTWARSYGFDTITLRRGREAES